MKKTVELLNVGNEVLCGKVVNTNASFLALELEKIGFSVKKVITIADDKDDLKKEVLTFLDSDIDYLVTTGGLGPTHDDFTKEVLFETVGLELVEFKEAIDLLHGYFGDNFAKCNLKQALYPKNSILLPNDLGTAMGAYVEHNNKMYTILVGPPFEMKPMVLNYLIPILKQKTYCDIIYKEYIVMGIGESAVEELLKDYYKEYSDVETAPYASIGKVRYQITSTLSNKKRFDEATAAFEKLMDDYIITSTNESIEEKVYQELKRLGYHISFAESCTGGMLASKLVNVSGSSAVMNESYVTYSEDAKMKILGVKKETIEKYDVVSKNVAIEMASGVQKITGSEVTVGVTGYAGPSGGTKDIPVGTVCFSIVIGNKEWSYERFFKTDRNTLREKTAMLIYYYLYANLKKIK
ncbi:MAG: CinA family nicotinamide mononucleotide deamidase-related protein [Bacilli bacterium]|nr:CinA family nicotinamide mononucleotide deamidase-related protein [Bacilli bacterium]